MMDPWLRKHLADTGVLTETGLTRKAKPRRCNRCNAVIVAGLDGDWCALEVHADAQPLNQAGEVLALAEGRRTLSLVMVAGGRQLEDRRPEHIRRDPAGATKREDVLRQHQCGTPPPPVAATAASAFAVASSTLPPGSPAPF